MYWKMSLIEFLHLNIKIVVLNTVWTNLKIHLSEVIKGRNEEVSNFIYIIDQLWCNFSLKNSGTSLKILLMMCNF